MSDVTGTEGWEKLVELLDLARQLPPGGRDEWLDDWIDCAETFSVVAFDEPNFETREGRTIDLLLKIAELARALAGGAKGETP